MPETKIRTRLVLLPKLWFHMRVPLVRSRIFYRLQFASTY